MAEPSTPPKATAVTRKWAIVGPEALTLLLAAALPFGFALPLTHGWGLSLVVLVVATWLAHRRARLVDAWFRRHGSPARALGALEPGDRLVVLGCTLTLAIPFVAVTGRGIAAMLVGFPGTLWALPVVLVGAALLAAIRATRWRLLVALLVVGAIPLASASGVRSERDVGDHHGWAISGPLYGTHPFQMTAIVIDGYGPFDLMVNDYVEPTGFRGYGPDALAREFERALHAIAEQQFADGPARAYQAFAEAKVTSELLPRVREKLYEAPESEDLQVRIRVQSGTTGPGSSVEFVCPGAREEPQGRSPDNLMIDACPNKYAAEGSAGLSVTGRWVGYAESRGEHGSSAARWFGWTHSSAARIREYELRFWSVFALVFALFVACMPSRRFVDGARLVGGLSGALGIVALTVLACTALTAIVVGVYEAAPGAPEPSLLEWLPAWILLAGFVPLARHSLDEDGHRDPVRWGALRLLLPLAATLWVASRLSVLEWQRPQLWAEGVEAPFAAFVAGFGHLLAVRSGLGQPACETAVAALCLAVLVGGLLAFVFELVVPLLAAIETRELRGARWAPWRARTMRAVLVLLPAAMLVFSRKTHGAAALLPGAVGVALVLGSCLELRAREAAASLRIARILHVVWIIVALALIVAAGRELPRISAFFVLASGVGVAAVLASLVFLRSRTPATRNVDTQRDATPKSMDREP